MTVGDGGEDGMVMVEGDSPYGGGGTYGVPKGWGNPKKDLLLVIFLEGINDRDYLICVFVFW